MYLLTLTFAFPFSIFFKVDLRILVSFGLIQNFEISDLAMVKFKKKSILQLPNFFSSVTKTNIDLSLFDRFNLRISVGPGNIFPIWKIIFEISGSPERNNQISGITD